MNPSQILPKYKRGDTSQLILRGITLISKLDKNITKNENYRLISPMNVDAKCLNNYSSVIYKKCVFGHSDDQIYISHI